MTKKELNTIKRAAYDAWTAIPENTELINIASQVTCWKVEEGSHIELIQTTADSQMNSSLLEEHHFTGSENIKKLFVANRKTKCLDRIRID